MFFTAFFGGLLSFISPCVLPLIPIYISYISGVAISDLKNSHSTNVYKKAFLNALAFVLGFSFVFTLLGTAVHSIASTLLVNKMLIAKFSGILIIIFGLMFLLEVFAQTPSKQDDKSKKCKLKKVFEFIKNNITKSYNFNDSIRKIVGNNTGRLFASFLIGVAFAFGWSPCVGPVLASILTMAMNTNNTVQASLLLFIYSLGLGLPFLFASLFMGFFLKAFLVFKTKLVSEFIGVFLIIIGIMMLLHGHLTVFL